jgi:hypothetical protein
MPITFKRSSKLSLGNVAYQYYKLHITGIRNNEDGFMQFSEFVFLLNGSNQNMSGATISLLDGHVSPNGEEVANLIDGDTATKFLDLNFNSDGTQIVFEFPSAISFNGYKWSTGFDADWRDPKDWILYGSNDNTNWVTLDSITNFQSTTQRYTFNESFEFGTNNTNIESKVTFTTNYVAPTNDGTTEERAGISAYQIKTDFPESEDGLYWIQNPNINSGSAFQIYADMTTDGGGWTLIMQNNFTNWTEAEALLKYQTTPPTTLATTSNGDDTQNYSIIGWADYLKSSPSGFQYMFDANTRGQYGGIWQANQNYSFTGSVDVAQYNAAGRNADSSPAYFGSPSYNDIVSGSAGFRQNISLIEKFPTNGGTWNYNNNGLESRMPWYSTNANFNVGDALITTTNEDGGSWWGTLITRGGWNPAPWQEDAGMGSPGIIWYWVR